MASESALSRAAYVWPEEVEVVGSTVIPPDPKIMEAIGLNYALEAAVADLVDNSIDAGAANVLIRFIRRGPKLVSLCVADNGRGMNEEELQQAMALGKRRNYKSSDLGHFGLGLKAASLGQATSLTVVSRSSQTRASGRRWLTKKAKDGFECEVIGQVYAEQLMNRPWGNFPLSTGTLVLWDDVLSYPRSQSANETSKYLEDTLPLLNNYLGLVFHRLIDDGTIAIEVDVEDIQLQETGPPQQVSPIDPFGYGRSGRSDYPRTVQLEVDSGCIQLECHIWPPQSRARAYKVPSLLGHKGQGFYFYRNDRLLQIGGWNGLYQPHSHHQLARVAVEFDDTLSHHLKMNPEKTQIRASDTLLRVIEAGNNDGFDLNVYREDAAQKQRESRTRPGTRQKVLPPGKGFAPAVRKAIGTELEFIVGEPPVDIRWQNIESETLFEIDRANRTIAVNSKYRWALIGHHGSSLNDAPLMKAMLYLLLKDLFEGEYLGPKEKDNLHLWQTILTAAASKEIE